MYIFLLRFGHASTHCCIIFRERLTLLRIFITPAKHILKVLDAISLTCMLFYSALYESIKEDRSFLPKAGEFMLSRNELNEAKHYFRTKIPGFITVAALGGVVAGYRNGAIKRTLYASIGGLTATAICYPHDVTAILHLPFLQFFFALGCCVIEQGMAKSEKFFKGNLSIGWCFRT